MKITPAASVSIMNLEAIEASSSFIRAFELSVDFAMNNIDDAHVRALVSIKDLRGAAYSVHAPFRDLNIASLNRGA